MFCDELKIKVIAGKGGNGCVSFRREKYVPHGGPDGGDGGDGGNIIVKVNNNLNTLSHLAHKKVYNAEDGTNGKGKKMYGKKGENLIIEVPLGTIIFNFDKSKIIADLSGKNSEIIVAKGGKGGMGNLRFKSSIHQTPRFAENGEPGEESDIILELKLVADVGIIGLPSAGKSTLISIISNARPKIAAYPFTTLIPNLGVVNMSKFGGDLNDSFVVADIPGLIEGAHKGKGLGHQFLKHITRTKLLIHIIDGYENNLKENYKTINSELKKFDSKLIKTDQIIALNKIDILSEEQIEQKVKELKKASKNKRIFAISAAACEGIKPLMFEILKKLIELKKKETSHPVKKEIPILKPHLNKVRFLIEKIIRKKDHKIFRIKGGKIEQLVIMTDLENEEGLERIYQYLEKLGIKKAVERNGAQIDDIIRIRQKDIPYRP